MWKTVMTLWLSSLSILSLASEENQPLYENVGNWGVRIDTSLGNGCFALATYEEGSVFRIGFNKTAGNMYMLIGDGKWESIERGKNYDVAVKFGDEIRWEAEAVGFSFDGVEDQPFLWINIGINEADDFMHEFKTERYVVVYYQDSEILRLTLKGSYRAGNTILKCQKDFNAFKDDPFKEKASGSSDPFAY